MRFRAVWFILVSALLLCWPLNTYSQAPSAATSSGDPQAGTGGLDAAAANNLASPLTQVQVQSWYHPRYDGTSGQGNDLLLRPILPFNAKGFIPSTVIRPALTLTSASLFIGTGVKHLVLGVIAD